MLRAMPIVFLVSVCSMLASAISHAQTPTTEQIELLEECRTEADSGYDCLLAGNAYRTSSTGWGTTVHQTDLAIARGAYDLGCDQGSIEACASLGEMLLAGEGGPIDQPGAAAAFEAVCSHDHTYESSLIHNESCFHWGLLALNGAQQGHDYVTAYTAFNEGCYRLFFQACTYMIVLEYEGQGPEERFHGNYALLLERLQRHCGQTNGPNACFTLGRFLRSAPDEFKNPELAFQATLKACQEGNWPVACLEVAKMLRSGEGVTPDLDEANSIIIGLCEAGFSPACDAD